MSATVHPILNRDRDEVRVPSPHGVTLLTYLSRKGLHGSLHSDTAGDVVVPVARASHLNDRKTSPGFVVSTVTPASTVNIGVVPSRTAWLGVPKKSVQRISPITDPMMGSDRTCT